MTENVDTGTDPLQEPEVLWADRGFPKAQELLAGVALARVAETLPVGWHDSALHPLQGAFCVVRRGSIYEDLLGEILIVTYLQKLAYVYCVATVDMAPDVSLARRAFRELSRLSRSTIQATLDIRA